MTTHGTSTFDPSEHAYCTLTYVPDEPPEPLYRIRWFHINEGDLEDCPVLYGRSETKRRVDDANQTYAGKIYYWGERQ